MQSFYIYDKRLFNMEIAEEVLSTELRAGNENAYR